MSNDEGGVASKLDGSEFYVKAKQQITEHPEKYLFGPQVALIPGMPLSGKTTLVSRLASLRDDTRCRRYLQVKRVTTRPQRVEETQVASDVVQFVDDATFNDYVRDGKFLFSYPVDGGGRTGILLESFSRERLASPHSVSPDAVVLVPIGRSLGFDRYVRSAVFASSPRILITTNDGVETLRNRAMRRKRVHDADDITLSDEVEEAIQQMIKSAVKCRTDFNDLLSLDTPSVDAVVANDFPFPNLDSLKTAPPDVRTTHFETYYDSRVKMIDAFLTSYSAFFNQLASERMPDKLGSQMTAINWNVTFIDWNDVMHYSQFVDESHRRNISLLYERMVNAQLEKIFGQGATHRSLHQRASSRRILFRIPPAVLSQVTELGSDERLDRRYVNRLLLNKKKNMVPNVQVKDGVLYVHLRSPLSRGFSTAHHQYSSMVHEYNTMAALLAGVLRQPIPEGVRSSSVPEELRFHQNGWGVSGRTYDALSGVRAAVSITLDPSTRLKSVVCELSSQQMGDSIYRVVLKPAGAK